MFDFQPKLTGCLLEMRGYEATDWPRLKAAASDPLIWDQHPIHRNWNEEFFAKSVNDSLSRGEGMIAIDRTSGEVAGYSRFTTQFVEEGEVEIGWTFLVRKYWGGKHNLEMKKMMLRHALEFWPIVIFRIGESNFRSQRALEKIGGKRIDRVSVVDFNGEKLNHFCYKIGRSDLQSLEGQANV